VLELNESAAEAVARHVLEETGVMVRAGKLSGVYKNMRLGVVTLAFRCSVIDEGAQPSGEARQVAWLAVDDADRLMVQASAVQVTDAVSTGGPAVRIHDGSNLLLGAPGSARGQSGGKEDARWDWSRGSRPAVAMAESLRTG
jgi:hypothetical protein